MSGELTQELLKKRLHYNPETGQFTWLVKCGRVTAGEAADYKNTAGYVVIKTRGTLYLAHRLAWLYMTGAWPHEIDHINLDRGDNRWVNLRDGTHAANCQNIKTPHRDNQTGFLGVSRHRKHFAASIMVDGERIRLGHHKTPELAHAAYVEAKRRLHVSNTL